MRVFLMVLVGVMGVSFSAGSESKVVVMVGDSITLGMRPWVAGALDGEAVVYGLPENGRYTGYALERWEDWMGGLVEIPAPNVSPQRHRGTEGETQRKEKSLTTKGTKGHEGGEGGNLRQDAAATKNEERGTKNDFVVDVVVLGQGLWDIARVMDGGGYRTPIEVYEGNVRALIGRGLGVNGPGGPGAAVVVSTITPVPAGFDVRTVDEDARRYNEVLARVVGEFRGRGERVVLCDLYGAALPNLGEWQKPGDIHFWSWGYRGLGERVALCARWAWSKEAWARMPVGGGWLLVAGVCMLAWGFWDGWCEAKAKRGERRRGVRRWGGWGR